MAIDNFNDRLEEPLPSPLSADHRISNTWLWEEASSHRRPELRYPAGKFASLSQLFARRS